MLSGVMFGSTSVLYSCYPILKLFLKFSYEVLRCMENKN